MTDSHNFFFLIKDREFPGGLVVKIPGFHCGDPVKFLVRKLRSCKLCCLAKEKIKYQEVPAKWKASI